MFSSMTVHMMVRCEDIIHPPEPRKRDSGRTDASSLFTREVITLPCKGMNTAPPERACHSTRMSEQYYFILYSVVPHSVVCAATDLNCPPNKERERYSISMLPMTDGCSGGLSL